MLGAQWCGSAWTTDGANGMWPMQVYLNGCGGPGISEWTPGNGLAGATCYGVKPSNGTTGIKPWIEALGTITTSIWSAVDGTAAARAQALKPIPKVIGTMNGVAVNGTKPILPEILATNSTDPASITSRTNLVYAIQDDGLVKCLATLSTLLSAGKTAEAGLVLSSTLYTYWETRTTREVEQNF
jgi:hypothetical protein